MANLGSGNGSSYPGSLDTQTPEIDYPAPGATKARAAVPNDLAAAVIAVEGALGINPQGTKADVKTFLQTQHNTDGTHNQSMIEAMTGLTLTSPVLTTPTINGGTIPASTLLKTDTNSKMVAAVAGVDYGVAMTVVKSALSSNVNLVTDNQFYDGPTVSLTAGTWFITGKIYVHYTGSSAPFVTGKLWDGTTVESSDEIQLSSNTGDGSLKLGGTVTVGSTTTWKISAASTIGNASNIYMAAACANNSAGNNACTLVAVRIA